MSVRFRSDLHLLGSFAVIPYAIYNTRSHTPMAVSETSPFDTEIFHIGETVDKESENWLWLYFSHGSQVHCSSYKNFVTRNSD